MSSCVPCRRECLGFGAALGTKYDRRARGERRKYTLYAGGAFGFGKSTSNHLAKMQRDFVDFSAGYTTLAAGIVLSIMVLPLLVSLFVELFSSVSVDLRDTAYALGSTRWQTAQKVVMRKSLPGIFASVVLAVSRALGETIAVLMVCGNLPQVPQSVFDACYSLPALIANNYGEMLSLPMYESALMFAALLLFVVVLLFNLVSRIILRKIEEN